MEKPVIKKKKGISPIWILPILALSIGGWLLYTSWRDAGIPIVIHFQNAEGITAGKTRVIYKGIPVGVVRKIKIDPGVNTISLHIEMDKQAKPGLVKDTKFWIVKPKVEAGRISGLDTLLSGSYIEARKGNSKESCREFVGLESPPPLPFSTPGLHIYLKTPQLGSIQRGTQLYHKNIPVGSVQDFKLDKNGTGVLITAFIEPRYQHLVHTKTRFWNSSGIYLSGGLSGFKVHMESLASLIYGGISLDTPEYQIKSPLAQNARTFKLYKDFDAAKFGIEMTLKLPSADGIMPDITKVMYHGFKAGVVTDITFNEQSTEVTAHINIDPRAEFVLREETKFWIVRPEISLKHIRNIETIVTGPYIAFSPGGGSFRNYFEASEPPRSGDLLPAGRHYKLVSKSSNSFSIGAPILFRRLKVGEIIDYDLTRDGKQIEAEILVYQKYTHLVQQNSVFWKSGGLELNASLNGIKLETGSIEALIAGGITFINPPTTKPSAAETNQSFTVFEEYQDAVKATVSLQERGLNVKLKTSLTKGFSVDSPVLYKSVSVGRIVDFHLDESGENVIVDIFVQKKYAHLLRATSLFYDISGITVKGGLSGIKLETGSIKSILTGGIAFFTPEPGPQAQQGTEFVLYESYEEARDIDKKLISIRFEKPDGLKDDLKICYQGITIGTVHKVEFTASMDGIICRALIDQRAVRLFTSGTRAWLVKPEVSLSGVKNLDTVVSGPYITIRPGTGELVDELVAENRPPALEESLSGLNLILVAERLGSLKKDDPVYYRQIQIGRVTGAKLSPDARQVYVHVNIEPPYDRLVHNGTRFWNVSGIRVKAGIFSGVKIDTESIESLVSGGISMATPEDKAMGGAARNGQHFILHENGKEEWQQWCPAISLH